MVSYARTFSAEPHRTGLQRDHPRGSVHKAYSRRVDRSSRSGALSLSLSFSIASGMWCPAKRAYSDY